MRTVSEVYVLGVGTNVDTALQSSPHENLDFVLVTCYYSSCMHCARFVLSTATQTMYITAYCYGLQVMNVLVHVLSGTDIPTYS